ncbi:MAG TPA: beta-galactosidase, partial [Chthonomonadaceae bacterium]|nr:beta-galactosidase [Chthonomonadaceae bacterium]
KYGDAFRFILARGATSAAIGTDQLGARRAAEGDEVGPYPYFCCEIGGGMETSYHRRIDMMPMDVGSAALVKIGSGNNLQGYYMYHGGTNPNGKLSTLQESQRTQYWNDVPVKSYDFQAPLGEFGQIRPHYHWLRRMHLFLHDWGATLATQSARLPVITPADSHDTATLRWSARTDGQSGFVFINNYQRLQPMPAREGLQFRLRLKEGDLTFPEQPFTVPADSVFCWPFHLDLGGATLIYVTAQPVCRVKEGKTAYVVFAQTAGLPAEFVFDSHGITVESATGQVMKAEGRIAVRQVKPGTGAALRLHTANGIINLVLLDEAQSLACWKGALEGRDRLFLTRAGLTLDHNTLSLCASDPADLTVGIFPPPAELTGDSGRISESNDGLFRRYTITPSPVDALTATLEMVRAAGPPRKIATGSQGVAEAPSDEDFGQAGVWRIKLPESVPPDRDLLLRIRYVGDVARLYLGETFLTDNFYNGQPFEIGLKRYAPDIYRKELRLEILPLRKDAPFYMPQSAWPDFGDAQSALHIAGVEVVDRHTVRLDAR